MHPSEEDGYHAEQTSDCIQCHTDFEEYPYGYYYAPYPSYWWDHSDYAHYYAYPWWWSYYDYPYQVHEYEPTVSPGRDTKFGRRDLTPEPSAPPYSDTRTRGWDDLPQEPGVYDIPGSYQISEPATTNSRTQPNTNDNETPAPAENTTKIERTSRTNTNSDDEGQNKPTRSRRTTDESSGDKKKKPRGKGDGK
jgi:hypothetical protein